MRILVTACLLVLATGCAFLWRNEAVLVTSHDQLSSLVGKRVELVGIVSNTKCPSVLGVDLWELDSHRGQTVRVRGRLRQYIVTAEELEAAWKEHGMFASRGPGTFYKVDKMTFEVIDSKVITSS